MDWVEFVGYVASAFVLGTFYMRRMVPLRCTAICSNFAFITYGYFGGLSGLDPPFVALAPQRRSTSPMRSIAARGPRPIRAMGNPAQAGCL